MSVIAWLYTVWLVIDIILFIIGCLVIVIGGMRRESEDRTMYGEMIRQAVGDAQRRRVRRAKAREQVLLEDDMADIRLKEPRA
jgi:hypothetical protein